MRFFNYLTLCVMMLLAACSQADIEQNFYAPQSGEELLYVLSEEGDTRVMLSEGKSIWQKDDYMSVFYGTATNQKWQYQGETGSNKGVLRPVGEGVAKGEGDIVALYPYNESNTLNAENYTVGSTLPATQSYVADSYDPASNLMVAQSSNSTLAMKNLCGWLRLSLTGNGEKVESIFIKGNNDEKLAGSITANSSTALLELATGNTHSEVNMTCGEGVTLSSNATNFYVTLPPQQYSKGLTVVIKCKDGKIMTKTTKAMTIARNTIQPMATIAFAEDVAEEEGEEIVYPANNQIWYLTYSGNPLTVTDNTFGAKVVEHEFGACIGDECYSFQCITFDKDITSIPAQALAKNEDIEVIYLPHSVKSIGAAAFFGCKMLSEVHLGKGIESIENGVFANSSQIKKVYCRATTPPTLGEYVLMADGGTGYDSYIQAMVYVPASSLDSYKSASRWSKFADYIRGYDFINGKEVTAGGSEGGDTNISNFNHRILLIDHTGVNCGFCPVAIDRLYALANYADTNPAFDFSDYYNEVQCHGGDFAGGDPAYSEAADIVDRFYKGAGILRGYPTFSINFRGGKVERGGYDWEFVEVNMNQAFKTHRKSLGADAGIKISNSISSDKINIDIEVTSAKLQEYKVTAWVLENNIYSPDQNGATTERHKTYHHALRYIAGAYSTSDISGDALGTIDVGKTASKSYSVPISSSWERNNLEVLVIVSAPDSSGNYEVVNTAVCPINSTKNYEYLK